MEKPKKNKPYMMYLKQSLSAVKPQYHAYRDGKNAVYTIEGDVTRHRFSVRQGDREVLVLHKKIAKLFAEYTIEKDGQEIAHIKKGLFRSLSGNVYDKSLEIRVAYESYNFDILVGGHKLCRIEQENASFRDRYEMMIFDSTLEAVAVALAVICDHVSDKADSTRYSD